MRYALTHGYDSDQKAKEEVYRMFQAAMSNYEPYFHKWSGDYEAGSGTNASVPPS